VWCYDHGKVEILEGVEVWQQIDNIHTMFGSAVDLDLIILRKKKERVTYTVQSAGATPFNAKIDPATIPSVDAYVAFLKENQEFMVPVSDFNTAPAPAPVAPAPVQPSAPVATKVTLPADPKERLQFEINDLVDQKFDGELFAKCLTSCIREIDTTTGHVKVKSKLEELDVPELTAFKAMYAKGITAAKS
jgi:hypothetical protein